MAMDLKRNMSLFAFIGLLGTGLLTLSGCDYWPPALQGENDALRAELNDALDDRQRLDQELEEVKAIQASLQQTIDERTRENHALTDRLNALSKPVLLPTQAKAALRSKPGSAPSAITKGSFTVLQLENPPRQGTKIREIQRHLRRHHLPIRIDGVYGQNTVAAVRGFQRTHGLQADGIVGPATYQALHRTENTAQTAQLVRHLWLQRPPAVGQDVLKIQRALRRAGYRVSLDGHYGPETDLAVTRFQRKHGMAPDGMVGPQTWNALMRRR